MKANLISRNLQTNYTQRNSNNARNVAFTGIIDDTKSINEDKKVDSQTIGAMVGFFVGTLGGAIGSGFSAGADFLGLTYGGMAAGTACGYKLGGAIYSLGNIIRGGKVSEDDKPQIEASVRNYEQSTEQLEEKAKEIAKGFEEENVKQALEKTLESTAKVKGTYKKVQRENKLKELAKIIIPAEENIKKAQGNYLVLNQEVARAAIARANSSLEGVIKEGVDELKLKLDNSKGLDKIAGYKYDKLGLESIKNNYLLEQNSTNIIAKKAFKQLIPNGMLIFGPSGNGKTTLAEGLIEDWKNSDINADFKKLSLSANGVDTFLKDFQDIQTQAKTNFKNEGKRTFLFLNELDRIAYADKTISDHLIVNMENCAKNGLTIIATTNDPKKLDKPLYQNSSRFNCKIFIEPPTKKDIQGILEYYTVDPKRKLISVSVDFEKLADAVVKKQDDGAYNNSSLKEIAQQVVAKASAKKSPIEQTDFLQVIEESMPVLNKNDITEFKENFQYITGKNYNAYRAKKDESEI